MFPYRPSFLIINIRNKVPSATSLNRLKSLVFFVFTLNPKYSFHSSCSPVPVFLLYTRGLFNHSPLVRGITSRCSHSCHSTYAIASPAPTPLLLAASRTLL